MQLNKESSPRLTKRRLKSATRFPKSQSTYVVAFALRETYDDLVTAQQMICNKKSPQESINSITPTNSLKIFESNQTVKLFQILDPDDKIQDKVIENTDTNQSKPNEIEIEDVTHKENADSNYHENETRIPFETNLDNRDDINQPEIIFNASNFGQKHKENKFVRKSKAHKNAKPRCCFKCKAPKNSICNRLEKYYEKTKQNNSVKSGNIQIGISNFTTVVSRTTVLKKGLAKENLLDENELISNELNWNDNDEHFNKNQSFISNLSENTLVKKPSTTSSRTDEPINIVESSKEISLNKTTPYKTDVINVAVAVAYKHAKICSTKESLIANKEKFTHLENLTSTESINKDMNELTSTIPSYVVELKPVVPNYSEVLSNATLVDGKLNFEKSSDDLFDMARTSSELNQPTDTFTSTLKKSEHKINVIKKKEETDFNKTNENKETLLQAVINLGCYTETSPSTSSAIALNDVIVTEHSNKSYSVGIKNKGDNHNLLAEESLLTKTFDNREVSPNIKNINLPNEAQIKAMIDGYDVQQRKCAEEVRHYSENVSEMWERLTLFFDVALKKLEQSVTDKIVKEVKETIIHNLQAPILHKKDIEMGDVEVIEPPVCNKLISAQRIKKETDESLQCDLVQNKILDHIMMKIITQGPKIVEPGLSPKSLHKLKKPKMLKDYFEVLKAPAVVDPQVVVDKADTVTMTTIISDGEVSNYRRLKLLVLGPLRFIRENVLVISSVPGFLVIILLLYGLLMLIIQSS